LRAFDKIDQKTKEGDRLETDVITIIQNFEKVLVAYINENYRSFTERDLERLIRGELRT